MESAVPDVVRLRSPWRIGLFRWYVRRYLAKHLHGVRLLGALPDLPPGPVVIALNHPSWWDPLLAALLSEHLPDRGHYAPIDAEQLDRYRFFRRLGFYGLERSRAGLVSFLRTSRALLAAPDTALWITAQGHFADPRQRPPALEPGVAALAEAMDGRGCVLPLALELPFWAEKRPEALLHFGAPLPAADLPPERSASLAVIEVALANAQDALAAASLTRDPAAFTTLLGGSVGVGGIYDLWRRARAALQGERFDPEHRARLPHEETA